MIQNFVKLPMKEFQVIEDIINNKEKVKSQKNDNQISFIKKHCNSAFYVASSILKV